MGILIVDSSVRHAELLNIALKKAGYTDIIIATTVKDVFRILEEKTRGDLSEIDLIIMELNMPQMTGTEACRLIRSSPNYRDIPVIMVTDQPDPNTLKLIFGTGALDYILKPVQKTVLLARVHSAMQLKRETDTRKTKEKDLIEANRLLSLEKEKTEQLLYNILPAKIVHELQTQGWTKPELYKNVTVLFSDIVDFTKLSSLLDPESLIDEMNEIFTGFDNIMEKNRCERIKTIGDAYLAVCGMPEEDSHHAENIAQAALEMIDYLNQRNVDTLIQWKIRVGIHSGDVVGSVVGVKKYIFDIFGDSVNIASRMQSNSVSMKINISESTYALINETFNCEERPAIMVKGKGKMKMYFVERRAVRDNYEESFTLFDLHKKFVNSEFR